MNLRKLTVLAFLVSAAAVIISTAAASFFNAQLPPITTPLVTLLSFIFALQHSADNFGRKRSLLLLGLTFGISLLFECVGVATGKIYGPYHYTDRLGAKFLGLVPLLIPAAWFMMMYPSFVITTHVLPKHWNGAIRLAGAAAIGAVVMTSWDLVMDPLMVAAGYWVWEEPGAYFGIPLQNYAGWWVTTFVTFFLFLLIGGVSLSRSDPDSAAFNRLAVASYLLIGLSSILLVFSFGMGGPGLVGLFAMLPWVILGL